MAVGIRVRDIYTNNLRLDTTDYTSAAYYTNSFSVPGSGSLVVPGINSSNFIAIMIPVVRNTDTFLTYIPRVYISGETVVWEVGPLWNGGVFTLMVLRIA